MSSSGIALFDLAERRLAYGDRRQEVLAQNIANASTPGWRARDLKSFSATLKTLSPGLAQTNPLHIAGKNGGPKAGQVLTGEMSPDGNGVKLDEELAKVADTEGTHALVTGLYTKYLGLFRTALGK